MKQWQNRTEKFQGTAIFETIKKLHAMKVKEYPAIHEQSPTGNPKPNYWPSPFLYVTSLKKQAELFRRDDLTEQTLTENRNDWL